jgi:uroporphyrinogen III methyltransferase/synthase
MSAVTVIGEVAGLRHVLNWAERRPLAGRRVVVTQRADLARPLVGALRERGAIVLEVPATRMLPHPDAAPLERALAQLGAYDWILFSNPLCVELFFERFFQTRRDLRQLGPVRLGAYGPRTGRKLRAWRLEPAAVAADHKTHLILEAFHQSGSVSGQRPLILREENAYEQVPEALVAEGAEVDAVACYVARAETRDASGGAAALLAEGVDWITFASGLAIEHFHGRFDLPRLLGRFPGARLALASGTVTWALERLGLRASAIGRPDDGEALAEAIVAAEAPGPPPPGRGTRSRASLDKPRRLRAAPTHPYPE